MCSSDLSPPPASAAHARIASPEKYDGSPDQCEGFLLQCPLAFAHQSSAYPSDAAKMAFIISHLTGSALKWATAVWKQQGASTVSIDCFLDHFRQVFDHPAQDKDDPAVTRVGPGSGLPLATTSQPFHFLGYKINHCLGN